MVFWAAAGYLAPLSGPSLSVGSAPIRQGTYSAVESLTVTDSGTGTIGSFVVTTTDAPASAEYCYYLESPENGTVLTTNCPPTATDPGSVLVGTSIRPGETVVVELLITGGNFGLGSEHQISVTSSSGAQASTEALVVPG